MIIGFVIYFFIFIFVLCNETIRYNIIFWIIGAIILYSNISSDFEIIPIVILISILIFSFILFWKDKKILGLTITEYQEYKSKENENAKFKNLKIEMTLEKELDEKIGKMQDLKEELDLYSRLDNLKSYGMFERPEYLFETSIRYEEQIRQVRAKQEDLIIKNLAVDIDDMVKNEAVTDFQIKALNDYIKMIIRAFNIECDFLINKVSVSSYAKTLKRISAISFELENLAQAFGLVFNEEFIKLKLLECQLVYEYRFKKKEEKEYLALERQKIRDEKQAQRDYEREIEEANFDEEKYQNLLMQTKKELELSKDKEILEIKILKLEALLKEAEERKQRAISMAQITKKGFIYIISNLGSFGENVYKIGMTRRLDPMDRVIELGDASVPFRFDVHAIIECDNAPQLEYDLHNFLSHKRVNAINLRKEFFRVSIEEIEQALDEILGKNNYDLKKDIKAEEYYQTQRML
ncbi:DUF4041 domain-containing protein [Campylobacter jejuni]|nr:DUF4041 domain-containing protein [Campylobacter jejuni]